MTIEELEQIAKNAQQERDKYDYEVNVCMDLACASQGAGQLKAALEKAAESCGKKVCVRRTGCMGPCPVTSSIWWRIACTAIRARAYRIGYHRLPLGRPPTQRRSITAIDYEIASSTAYRSNPEPNQRIVRMPTPQPCLITLKWYVTKSNTTSLWARCVLPIAHRSQQCTLHVVVRPGKSPRTRSRPVEEPQPRCRTCESLLQSTTPFPTPLRVLGPENHIKDCFLSFSVAADAQRSPPPMGFITNF